MHEDRRVRVSLLLGAAALAATAACDASPGDDAQAASGRARGSAGSEASAMRTDSETPSPPRVSWREPVTVASGGGRVGPWRMNESDWRYVDDPAVALDGNGGVAVAWVDQARKDVFLQRYGPGGEPLLEAPVDVSRSPDVFSWLPRLVVGPGEPPHLYLLWQEIVFSGGTHGGEAFFARSTDGGRSFEAPINLSESPAGDGKGRLTRRRWDNGSLDLARGPEGDLYAAWTEYEGNLWLARSTDAGAGFSEPLRVAGDGPNGPARAPSLAVGPGGTVHLAWTVGEDPGADVRLASSDDGGRSFGEPRNAVATDGHSDVPALALDGEGILHLAWGESPEGPLERYHVRYARSAAGADGFEGSRRISSPPDERFEAAHAPSLALDARGRLHALWELYPDAEERPRRGLGYTRSADGGRTFASPVVVPGTAEPGLGVNGSLQGLLARKLAAGDGGAVAVVNSRFLPRNASHVRLVRGRAAKRERREESAER